MAHNDYIEKLDDYFRGNLSNEEVKKIEELMNQDAGFKQEVDLQRDIIEGLKAQRRAELKQRLKQVKVTPPKSTGNWLMPSLIGGGLALGGLALFFGLDLQDTPEQVSNESVVVDTTPKEDANANQEVPESSTVIIAETEDTNELAESLAVVTEEPASAAEPKNEVVTPKVPVMPTLPDENGDELPTFDDNVESEIPTISKEQVEQTGIIPTIEKKRNRFHYKYDGEHLTLVGDFSKDTPTVYELSYNKDVLYLNYDKAFYEIHNTGKLTKLVKVNDPQVIKALQQK